VVIEDVTVDSDLEVTLHLTEPNFQIPLLLAGLIGHLLSPQQIDSDANIALEPVGAGPFRLQEYVPDSRAVLARNPDYWNADAFGFDELTVVPKPESSVAVPGVVSGQYTIAQIENSQIETSRNGNLRTDVNTIFNVYTLQVNTRFDPFTDDRVTQALSHAVNRQQIVDSILFGHGTATWQPFTKDYLAYDPSLENLYPHDVAKAKQLLADAGHPDGIDVDLYIDADPLIQQISEVIQTQVADAGIRLSLKVSPAGGGILQAHDYTLNFSSFSGRESPAQGLEVLYSDGGWMNIAEQGSENLPDALQAIRSTPLDDPDYAATVRRATHVAVTERAPHVFLVNWVRAFAISDEVQGFDPYQHTQRFEGVSLTG
jgi:peptide/nickel transport system substrate-binding protein